MSFLKDVLQLIGITSAIAVFAIGIIVLLSIYPFCIMLLWNWLLPHIFGIATINFWEALGITIMAWILFK